MKEKCHFIGIGGIGMSGLAKILLSKKVEVSGSDVASNYITENLLKAGAQVYQGHSPKHISPDMTVVYSTDIKKDNPEYLEALQLKCKMLHRSDLLLQLMQGSKTLAVAGTHGKTTTSALLTAVLLEAGLDPTFAVGGMLPQLKANAGAGEGEFIVAEADESDGTFLKYDPYGAIVTNIDCDHMDYYRTEETLVEAFKTFMLKVSSPASLFWCGDDPRLEKIKPAGIRYGFGSDCDLRLLNFRQEGWRVIYDIQFMGHHYSDVEIPLAGRHNALNSAAVFGISLSIGVPEDSIRKAMKSFKGVGRRCEIKGEANKVLLLDDYAHHPTEIKATLSAVREAIKEKRLIVVFQPHRFSRTQACLGSFGDIFGEADLLFVTDIYGAGEAPIPGLTSFTIMEEIESRLNIPSQLVPREYLAREISSILEPNDVVITLGAGDITELGGDLLAVLQKQPPRKLKVGIVYGGRSVEHEVSLMSAQYIKSALCEEHYDLVEFKINKDGTWKTRDEKEIPTDGEEGKAKRQVIDLWAMQALEECDVLFPVLHGRFGEDGTIQGLFDMIGKPYVGCDHRASAVSMDKALTKKLMILNGIATIPFVDFNHYDWMSRREPLLHKIESQLIYPLFVKPIHLGSTIGVKKVQDHRQLVEAIEAAFSLDNHVIVENGLKIREIEFAVLGNRWIKVFPPGEIITGGDVYDYNSKYGAAASETTPKAKLSDKLIEEGCFLAETAYKAAGCQGLARVDFFLDAEGKYWLNEINPIPGFTPYSLYPQMCEANGMGRAELLDQLIILALHRYRQLQRIS